MRLGNEGVQSDPRWANVETLAGKVVEKSVPATGRGYGQTATSQDCTADGPVAPQQLGQLPLCQFSDIQPCGVLKRDEIAVDVDVTRPDRSDPDAHSSVRLHTNP
ncbi:hypothetical protein KIN20_030023 [Parelaphostrongylus tenuis]|uniref:Uncharacterized protein n=1 Tax=Parelaphostrongylus tenuis TaxID=148309 RepID=A0AAD5WFV2_PARTN|nr:hypothetical protein KIN20_030023 [Parelaphostrongylus tenuis]